MTRLGFMLVAASLNAQVTRKQLPNAFLISLIVVRRQQEEKSSYACASSFDRTSNGPHHTLCSSLTEDTHSDGIFVRMPTSINKRPAF
jgi:hypothetical protein